MAEVVGAIQAEHEGAVAFDANGAVGQFLSFNAGVRRTRDEKRSNRGEREKGRKGANHAPWGHSF
jgi:hypothetical protein